MRCFSLFVSRLLARARSAYLSVVCEKALASFLAGELNGSVFSSVLESKDKEIANCLALGIKRCDLMAYGHLDPKDFNADSVPVDFWKSHGSDE